MKGKTLYLIVAASGGGKDYITDKLCKEFGKKKVISRTTRQPRFKGENTHLFVSEEQADKEFNGAVAKTIFNGYRYYTTKEDLQSSDFYAIDPQGVYSLKDKSNMMTVFINAPWYRRAWNMKKRGDSIKSIIVRLRHDRKAFKDFEGDLNFKSSQDYYNYFKEVFQNE